MATIVADRQRRQAKRSRRQRRQQRKTQQRARRQLHRLEEQAPSALRCLFRAFAEVFTRPTYYRFFVLLLAFAEVRGQRLPVRVAALPFVPHSYKR